MYRGFASDAMGFVHGAGGAIGGLPMVRNSFIADGRIYDQEAVAAGAGFYLHDSMQWDFGQSLRIMASTATGRLDLVWSEEDAAAWLIYGHPF